MSDKKYEILHLILLTTFQGIVNGVVIFVILKIFKLV